MNKQVNDHLYSLVSPSTASPDHTRTGVTDYNASELLTDRKLASQAKWNRQKGWWVLADPSYYNDILNATTLTSSDFVGADQPVVGGQLVSQRFGFNIVEDNSAGLQTISAGGSEDAALIFSPDFLHLVMQREANFMVSSKHPNNEFGFVISVDIIFGAGLGNDGDVKHITVTA